MIWTDSLADLLRDVAKTRPQVGMRARAMSGKRRGVIGRITWHGRDRFASTRYCDETMRHLRECMGVHGFRVRIEPNEGEPFFIAADKIVYCIEGNQP